MVLHSETLVFINTAIVATVAEVESGYTFRETCFATEIKKRFHETDQLHGAIPPELTCFAAPLLLRFSYKFQRVTAPLASQVAKAIVDHVSCTCSTKKR